ncbi:MAG: diguanylate cyclase, partial [Granulosicoccaceae bacterium]
MKTAPTPTFDTNGMAEHILSALSDGVIGVNAQGQITFINQVACNLTGWTQDAAIEQPLESVFALEGSTQSLEPAFLQRILKRQVGIGPITKQQLQNRAGDKLLIDYSITPLDTDSAVIMFHDLSHVQDESRTLLYQVSYDPLTRLPNREATTQTLHQIHNRLSAHNDTYSILMFDLDRFKLINDNYGHAAGDVLLHKLARLMYESLRPQDNLGRWGGEEFLCILPNTDLSVAVDIAERMRDMIDKRTIQVNKQHLNTTTSIGVSN